MNLDKIRINIEGCQMYKLADRIESVEEDDY